MISCIFYENSYDNNAKLQIMRILMSTFICQLWDDKIYRIMLNHICKIIKYSLWDISEIEGGFPMENESQIS